MPHSRNKGKRGERMARDQLRPLWPGCERGAQQSRSGSDQPDVEGTPFWVEVKVGARPNIRAAYDQATEATDGRPVLVMSKKDRQPWLVTMDVETFRRLLEGESDESA